MREFAYKNQQYGQRASAAGAVMRTVVWLGLAAGVAAHAQMQLVFGIMTVAGDGSNITSGDGGAATAAGINNPSSLYVDSSGNLYIAEQYGCLIRKVTIATGIITTVAGNGTCATSGDGSAATSAGINGPNAVAFDSAGNIYIAEAWGNRIRKVTVSTGIISTVAGNGTGWFSGDGAAATSAELWNPSGLAVDSSGNIYIADRDNNRIRKVTASTEYISTVAGNGTAGFSGDGSSATGAELAAPNAVALDSAGNIYIADSNNSRIRMVTVSSGNISTVAGNGTWGFSGDSAAATSAELNYPNGVAVDSAGNIYISDTSNLRIRQVNAGSGIISTIAGSGSSGSSGNDGPAISAQAEYPNGLTVDGWGNVYYADSGTEKVMKISLGTLLPAAAIGSSSGPQNIFIETTSIETITSITAAQSQGSQQEFSVGTITGCTVDGVTSNPSGTFCTIPITFSPAYPGARNVALTTATGTGSVTFGLTGTGTGPLAALTPGVISTIGGTGTACATSTAACGDGGAATSAQLSNPQSVAVDSDGNVYIADAGNNRIRKIAASTGYISTVAGNGTASYLGDGGAATSAELNYPAGVALDSAGNIYISDLSNERVRKVTAASGVITTVAGGGGWGFSGDGGSATSAELESPWGIALDSMNNIYFADWTNYRIRKVTASTGIITTIAGNGTAAYSGDGGAATSGELSYPVGVQTDSDGNIYIGDWGNNRIRKVSASTGIITTVAGNGTQGYSGDGSADTGAEFFNPAGIAFDSAGNFYIADEYNYRIREVNLASGIISTVAGNGSVAYAGDGGAATSAELDAPPGIALDSAGNIYIADAVNNVIRKVTVNESKLTFHTSTAVGTLDGNDDPQTTTVSNIGNAALTVSAPSTGTNPSVSAYFELDAATTCPELNTSSSAGTLAAGSVCTYAVDFAPVTVGGVSGSVVLTDNSLNAPGSTQTISLTGTAIAVNTTTTVTSSANPSTYSGLVTFTATVAPGSGSAFPTGTVQFSMDGSNVGSPVTLSSGTATYTTSTLTANTHSMLATYTPNSTSFNSSASSTLTQTVNQAAPTISFSVANQTYGAAPFSVAATSNSAGAFTYSVVSGPASVTGATVTLTGIGTVVMQATEAANGNYTAKTQNASFSVAAAAPTISFSVANQTYGAAPFSVAATSNSAGAFTYSVVSGPASVTGATVTLTGVGTVVLQAAQAANGNYTAATQNASFSVAAEAPTISFSVADKTYGVAPFTVTATSNSVGAFTYSVVSGPASVTGATVTLTGAGTVVLQAAQAANGNYTAASATTSFAVNLAPSASSVTSNFNPALLQSAVTLTATVSSAAGTPTGVVTFFDGATALGTGTLAGGVATLTTSFLIAGNQPITAVYGGDTNFAKSTSGTFTLTVIDFSVINPASGSGGRSQTVIPGVAPTYTATIVPTSGTVLPAPVTLTMSGMPTGATATITPSSWTQLTNTSWSFPANTQLADLSISIQLPVPTANAEREDSTSRRFPPVIWGILLLPFAAKLRRAARRLGGTISVFLLLAVGFAGVAGLSGCGSTTGLFAPPSTTYTMTLTATAGTLSHSTTMTLTVE